MNDRLLIIGIGLAIIAVGVVAWFVMQKQRSQRLREQFGPEYEQAVGEVGDRRRAESELMQRRERVERLKIVPLAREDADALGRRWQDVQARFVDDPTDAVREADALLKETMRKRGYPIENFEQRVADVSVDHPQVVSNYRDARAIAVKNESGRASTEDLRLAIVHYRALFADLLEDSASERGQRIAG